MEKSGASALWKSVSHTSKPQNFTSILSPCRLFFKVIHHPSSPRHHRPQRPWPQRWGQTVHPWSMHRPRPYKPPGQLVGSKQNNGSKVWTSIGMKNGQFPPPLKKRIARPWKNDEGFQEIRFLFGVGLFSGANWLLVLGLGKLGMIVIHCHLTDLVW